MSFDGNNSLCFRDGKSRKQRLFALASKGNPRQSRGNKKGYGVEESKKEKVSKLE